MLRTWAFGMLFFIAARIPLYPQEVVVAVEDTDLNLPLEGAVIRSWDGEEYTCDAEGKAVIPVPADRQVVIHAAYPGYENGRLVIAPGASGPLVLGLRLSSFMEHQELVIEARRTGESETRTGRSVGIADRALSQTAEIGIVEDVMTSIKLLPGVGYSGMFNALPSIRGGEPGDLTAVFDGFYISSPYHWGGGVSIFDPRMVKSARLSHGVFSARYGHTISGLLEITARSPSSEEMEAELGVSSSAANLNISYPLGPLGKKNKGGIMLMGKTTYWDPFIEFAKLFVEEVNYVKVAPYIRSAALSAHYRFTADLEASAHGFIGTDGVGALFENRYEEPGKLKGETNLKFDWNNSIGFLIAGFTLNPAPQMALKATAGIGFHNAAVAGYMKDRIQVWYSDEFKERIRDRWPALIPMIRDDYYNLDQTLHIEDTEGVANVQAGADFDWDYGKGLLFAFGVQELYSRFTSSAAIEANLERQYGSVKDYFTLPPPLAGSIPDDVYLHYPFYYTIDVANQIFNSSLYAAAEYTSADRRFGAELGLRLDHIYFVGRDFSIQTYPAVNPRLNLDFTVLEDRGIIESLSATVGTGLFSSINDTISYIESRYGIADFDLRQNRSWTSVLGAKIDIAGGFSFNIETYFKYVFDRAYMYGNLEPGRDDVAQFRFDGQGVIAGFDLMLQKFESRYWDGWLSYSFNYARYRNPQGDPSSSVGRDWYYPSFHRFHNLNLILTVKPVSRVAVTTRFGLASGRPKPAVGAIESYPVLLFDPYDPSNPSNGTIIEKWKRSSSYSDSERTTWSIPLDLKVSLFFFNPKGKSQGELYVAIENLTSLVYKAQANTSFNAYTGKEETGSDAAAYEIPLPLPSVGFKWTY
ncbi:MAG: TonB-dependent receptor plug domain-containing protein [Spirochaetaceae bacterium]|jgi:hypothetical protein|nr:TonB-dependent receptor plug domain-containing protein [Spirochaetaceae bacterium]